MRALALLGCLGILVMPAAAGSIALPDLEAGSTTNGTDAARPGPSAIPTWTPSATAAPRRSEGTEVPAAGGALAIASSTDDVDGIQPGSPPAFRDLIVQESSDTAACVRPPRIIIVDASAEGREVRRTLVVAPMGERASTFCFYGAVRVPALLSEIGDHHDCDHDLDEVDASAEAQVGPLRAGASVRLVPSPSASPSATPSASGTAAGGR